MNPPLDTVSTVTFGPELIDAIRRVASPLRNIP